MIDLAKSTPTKL